MIPLRKPVDLFSRLRTAEELRALVFKVARQTPRPFSVLVSHLVGQRVSEEKARRLWGEFVSHRRALAMTLGRPVHLRAAAFDWLTQSGKSSPGTVFDEETLERLWVAATTDPLTGLANRRQLVATIAHHLAQRKPRALALAFVDLDGFKGVNDRLGHAAGDAALRAAARGLKSAARAGDVAARLGGDEFALLIVGADGELGPLGARVKQAIDTRLAKMGSGCTVGVARARPDDTVDALLERADAAMYRLKPRTHRRRPSDGSARAVVCVLATQKAEVLLNVQTVAAPHGVAVVPARGVDQLNALMGLLDPVAVLADLLMPPHGGPALLDLLQRSHGSRQMVVVLPQAGFAMKGGQGVRRPLVTADPRDGNLASLFKRLASPGSPPVLPLASAAEAGDLLRAVDQLARGAQLSSARVAGLEHLAEFDLVRRALGS